jgi:hypothetical protein
MILKSLALGLKQYVFINKYLVEYYAWAVLGIKPRALHILGRNSTSPAQKSTF